MVEYCGRTQIFTNEDEINESNLISVLQKAMMKHNKNRSQIEYLYKYYKGRQPILDRTKEIRPEICNKIVENWANKIVSFKVGYLCNSPIQYVSGNGKNEENSESISQMIDLLNKNMDAIGKSTIDKDLFEWQMIAGTSFRMALPGEDDVPFDIDSLDPRYSFVIYKNDVKKKPLAGVTYVTTTENQMQIKFYSVYTNNCYYEVKDDKIVKTEPHILPEIPIIEYPANNARLGAFEVVLGLLDAINDLDSNRLDGVEQFIQSLMIIYNATLDGQTANDIREKGLIELKSIGENRADVKILSEQLDQSQTQTLKEDLIQRVREIVGLPSQNDGSTSDSLNNGAALLRGGWEDAETRAKESELMFKKSEQTFLKLIMYYCSSFENSGIDLDYKDIDIRFTRRNYENLQVKAQVLTTMLACDKIAPKLGFQACGLFVDAEEAYRESVKYIEEAEKNADRRTEQPNNGNPNGNNGVSGGQEESD